MANEPILVVDDDKEIARLLRSYLEQAQFDVYIAHNGETALHMLRRERPALLLLDLMLPDRDGWDLTRTIRSDARLADLPIIMITARVEDTDKILGLELGADDYVTKPFNPREVLARVRALLRRDRRASAVHSIVLTVGGLKCDAERHLVTLDGEPVDLTPTEFNLLKTLMQAPGYVFTRDELMEQALGYAYEGMDRTLDSHIRNLRRKIEADPRAPRYVQTVYGIGYRLGEATE
jgi:two-component system alkaline phosphatase synthesis response regulator PhoP